LKENDEYIGGIMLIRNKYLTTTALSTLLMFSTLGPNIGHAQMSEKEFNDVKKEYSSYEAIMSLTDRGIIDGYTDGTFKPNEAVSRAHVAKLIVEMLDLDLKNVVNPGFKDVPTSNPNYAYIAALENEGIISGFKDGNFRPNTKLKRSQIVKIISEAFNFEQKDLTSQAFKDVGQSEYYAKYIQALIDQKITNGTSPTTFSPNALVSRGQLASFIYRSDSSVNGTYNTANIKEVSNNKLVTSEGTFEIESNLSGLFDVKNQDALKNANIGFRIENNKVSSIEMLTLNNSGTVSNKVVFDGGLNTIDGDVFIKGDNIELKSLVIKKDLIVSGEVKSAFDGKDLTVHGETLVQKSSLTAAISSLISIATISTTSTITLDNVSMNFLSVSKKDLKLNFTNNSSVDTMDIKQNVNVEASDSSKIKNMTISGFVSELELNADIINLILKSKSAITVSGSGNITNATIDSLESINLNTTGIIKKLDVGLNSNLELGSNIKVEDIALPAGKELKDIINNYEDIKGNIDNVDGVKNPDATPPSSGGGGSQPAVTPTVEAATTAVVTAEASKTKADLDAAQKAVAALTNGATKTALQARLSNAALNNPTVTVFPYEGYAENTVFQTNVNFNGGLKLTDFSSIEISLYNGETLLATNSAKAALLSQDLAGATDLFGIGDEEELLLDKNWNIGAYSSDLAPTSVKFTLTRTTGAVYTVTGNLDAGSANAILEGATTAVVTAEASKAKADLDAAQTAVAALTNGATKTALQARLSNAALNNPTVTVFPYEGYAENTVFQTNVNFNGGLKLTDFSSIEISLYNGETLLATNSAKAALLSQDLAGATDLFGIGDEEELLLDKNWNIGAYSSDLAPTSVKFTLTRTTGAVYTVTGNLDAGSANAILEGATTAVVTAEASKAKADLDAAQTAVAALTNGATKTALQERLSNAALNNPTVMVFPYVGYPDNTVFQTNVNFNGGLKLTDFSSIVISLYNGETLLATNSAKAALLSKDFAGATDLFGIRDIANDDDPNWNIGAYSSDLAPTSVKFTLTRTTGAVYTVTGNLDATSGNAILEGATTAVTTAEASKAKADLDAAQKAVAALTNGATKTALQERLSNAALNNPTVMVFPYVGYPDNTVFQTNVNFNGGLKLTDFSSIVISLYNGETLLATNSAKAALLSKDFAGATDLFGIRDIANDDDPNWNIGAYSSDLAPTSVKFTLTRTTGAVYTVTGNLDATSGNAILEGATTAVTTAEASKAKADLDAAQKAVAALTNGATKTALQERLSNAALNNPTVTVFPYEGYAENTVFQTNVNFNGGLKLTDFSSIVISLYNGETLLATNSAKDHLLSQDLAGATDLFGIGDEEELILDDNWNIGAYSSDLAPTSVKFTLTRKTGAVYTVTATVTPY
jgi:hypothetical protein